jgi:hypothetical protein
MRRWALLVLALWLCAVAPAAARPDPVATTSMVAKKKAKPCTRKHGHKLTKKQRRRCLKARKKKAAAKTPAAAPVPTAPTGPAAPAPGTPTPTPDPGDTVPPLPPSNPHALQVISGEYFLNLSKGQVDAGDVRVEFNNAFAEDPHDLHLVSPDGQTDYAFGELRSGEIEAKTLDLSKGAWQLFCALPEHAKRGMTATLKVVAG